MKSGIISGCPTTTCTGSRMRRDQPGVSRGDVRARRAGALRATVVRARTRRCGARHGANGAGKSSLTRLAAGLLQPARGAVEGEAARALLTEEASLDDELPLA